MSFFSHLVSLPNRFVAEPILQLLQAHGLNARIVADDMGGIDLSLGGPLSARIQVAGEDFEEASRLLASYQEAPLLETDDWKN